MVTPRLDAPFVAIRRYGLNPLAVGFDFLTLPFQVSNVLTGIPPLTVPDLPTTLVIPLPPTFNFPGVDLAPGEGMSNIKITFRAIGGIPTGQQGSHVGFPLGATGTGIQITATFTYQGPGTPVRLAAVSDQAPSDVRNTTANLPLSPSPSTQTMTVNLPLSAASLVVHGVTATLVALDPAGALKKAIGSGTHNYPVFIPESYGSPSVALSPLASFIAFGTPAIVANASAGLTYTGPGTYVTLEMTDTVPAQPLTVNTAAFNIPQSPTPRVVAVANSLSINTTFAGVHTVEARLVKPNLSLLARTQQTFEVYYPEVFGPVTFGF